MDFFDAAFATASLLGGPDTHVPAPDAGSAASDPGGAEQGSARRLDTLLVRSTIIVFSKTVPRQEIFSRRPFINENQSTLLVIETLIFPGRWIPALDPWSYST